MALAKWHDARVTTKKSEKRTMSYANAVRAAGLTGVVAGFAYAATGVVDRLGPLYPRNSMSPSEYLDQYVFLVALVGSAITVAGLHASQRDRYGWAGAVGASVALLGHLLFLYVTVWQIIARTGVGPGMQEFAFWSVLLGLALVGVATLRARVLPLWCGLVLVAGFPILWYFGPAVGTALGSWLPVGVYLGLFWVAVGYALLSRNHVVPSRPVHPTT